MDPSDRDPQSTAVTPSTYTRGQQFEELAAQYLTHRGWSILARNFRAHREEIDLVIGRGQLVAFVEVRGRGSDRWGHPLETIDRRKQAAIRRVAREWIRSHPGPGRSYRFDAIAVLPGPDGWTMEHVEDAFRAGDSGA